MKRTSIKLALYKLLKESPKRSIDEKLKFMEKRVAALVKCSDGENGRLTPHSGVLNLILKKWAFQITKITD